MWKPLSNPDQQLLPSAQKLRANYPLLHPSNDDFSHHYRISCIIDELVLKKSDFAEILLSDWKLKLDELECDPQAIISFFTAFDFIEHWNGEKSVTDLYMDAISGKKITGEFVKRVQELEPE